MTDRQRIPDNLRSKPSNSRAQRSQRPAHAAKILAAGLTSTAVLGLTAFLGWEAERSSVSASAPTEIDPELQALIDQTAQQAVAAYAASIATASPPTKVAAAQPGVVETGVVVSTEPTGAAPAQANTQAPAPAHAPAPVAAPVEPIPIAVPVPQPAPVPVEPAATTQASQ